MKTAVLLVGLLTSAIASSAVAQDAFVDRDSHDLALVQTFEVDGLARVGVLSATLGEEELAQVEPDFMLEGSLCEALPSYNEGAWFGLYDANGFLGYQTVDGCGVIVVGGEPQLVSWVSGELFDARAQVMGWQGVALPSTSPEKGIEPVDRCALETARGVIGGDCNGEQALTWSNEGGTTVLATGPIDRAWTLELLTPHVGLVIEQAGQRALWRLDEQGAYLVAALPSL